MASLTLRQVTAFYGASQALFGIDLDIGSGEVLALLGRNGMGKSTTIKTICHMVPLRTGEITFDGVRIERLASYKIGQMGVGLVPEGRRCFTNLTVEENLLAAARRGAWTLESVAELFPRLAERRGQNAGSLSGGEQQMLAIGRALMTNPSLLILDEATEGLAPLIRQEIWAVIAKLKAETGLSILLVDKSFKEMSAIADRAVILERGKSVWSGPMAELTPDLRDQYLGL